MIQDEIYTLLTGSTSPQVTEAYPVVIPQQATYPAVRYARITSTREMNHEEVEQWVRSVFQIDSYAHSYNAALDLSESVKAAINDYTGGTIQQIRLDFEAESLEDDTDLFRVMQQYTIWHRET